MDQFCKGTHYNAPFCLDSIFSNFLWVLALGVILLLYTVTGPDTI